MTSMTSATQGVGWVRFVLAFGVVVALAFSTAMAITFEIALDAPVLHG